MSKNDFETIVRELAAEKGVELPDFTCDSPLRPAYLDLLALNGLTEDAVCGILLDSRTSGEILHANAKAQAVALQALLANAGGDGDPTLFRAAATMLLLHTNRPNANVLVHQIGRKMIRELAEVSVAMPEHYVGVFPIGSFNAQCMIHCDANLILLDTGCFSMLEIAVSTFLESQQQSRRAGELLMRVLDEYSQHHVVANHETIFGARRESGLSIALTTSAEEFVIAHELGHLALGHLDLADRYVLRDFRRGPGPPRPGRAKGVLSSGGAPNDLGVHDIAVLRKSLFDEFTADAWATVRVIERANTHDDEACAVACAGPVLFLAVAHLLEALLTAKGQKISDGHPPASDRLYNVNCLLEILGHHENAYVARRILEFVEEVGERYIPGFEMPPILSRDLNQTLHDVLTTLEIDFSKSDFVTEFR